MIGRRPLILAGLAAALLPAAGRTAAADAFAFAVHRNGRPIGRHAVRIERSGEELRVGIDIRLEVRLAFIPLYTYHHRNDELWREGRLVALETVTDDNGTPHFVRGRAAGARFVVESSAGSLNLPADVMPTSYWHPDSMAQQSWLDTQSGRLVTAEVVRLGTEPVDVAGRKIEAERFRLEGELALDIWYWNGVWVGLRFAGPDGSTIDYALEAEPVIAWRQG